MTTRPVPRPGPADLPVLAMAALVHQLARAYVDRRPEAVAAADEDICAIRFTDPDPNVDRPNPVDPDMMRDHHAVQSAGLMMEEWLAKDAARAQIPDVLTAARRLAADNAPPTMRGPLRDAFDQIIAGDADLYADVPAGLTGRTGAHLYAAATAAIIDLMHPMVHNHARLVLEERIRGSQALSQGIPGAEALAYVSEHEAAQLLTELLPWVADTTGDAHEATKRDLRALIQLYLLDHPVPTVEQKAELKTRLGDRIEELATGRLKPRVRGPAAPAPRLTPEQQAARRRAESDRRRAKKKRGR
ncbi:hypothetical protein EDC02_7654 [Micromonospora sp. Llam0]|uniref:hypothetical protein n=1 Tax=Micromonospora sp. Llam0 TaxID=2485143 RepID=UPI000F48A528|nr:hypothetical protein [Micromonospora sp. Llam0]ROO52713.1 hypothetical protein EDC02_7654 [Micromonospora sp. Llam0]